MEPDPSERVVASVDTAPNAGGGAALRFATYGCPVSLPGTPDC
jgi:hypothetical protein